MWFQTQSTIDVASGFGGTIAEFEVTEHNGLENSVYSFFLWYTTEKNPDQINTMQEWLFCPNLSRGK